MHTDRTNYIYIDYENIRDIDLALIDDKPVRVMIALGRQQTSLPKDFVKLLLRFSDRVSIIENTCAGKNALDFVIVYEIAKQALVDPKGFFHVVSKDKGFDALVAHLKTTQVLAARHDVFSGIPILSNPKALSHSDRVARYVEYLKQHPKSRPARKKTLLSQINGHFLKALSESECEAIVSDLIRIDHLSISDTGKVTYTI